MKALKFYLTYYLLKRRYKELLKPYLCEDGTISISLLTKCIKITGYKIELHSKIETILLLLNEMNSEYFEIDEYSITPFKIVFKSQKLKNYFQLSKRYKFKVNKIPMGINTKNKIIEIDTNQTSSTMISIPSGAGKSYFIKNVIRELINNTEIEIVIINAKRDAEYDEFENKLLIIKDQNEALKYFQGLEKSIVENQRARILIIDEYAQFCEPNKFRFDKEKKETALQLGSRLETASQTYRSLGVHLILLTQNLNKSENPIDCTNFNNKIFGFITQAQANANSIDNKALIARPDLIRGKFIVSLNNSKFEIFRGLSARK